MPVGFQFLGTIFGGGFDLPAGMVSISVMVSGGFTVVNYGYGETRTFSVAGNVLTPTDGWSHAGAGRVAITLSDGGYSLLSSTITAAFSAWEAGAFGAQETFLAPGAHQANAASVLAMTVDGSQLLFVATAGGAGIHGYSVAENGALSAPVYTADTATSHGAAISDMTVVGTGAGYFLFVASSSEHGLTGYRIGTGGGLTEVVSLGRENSLPVQDITVLASAEVAGQSYVIVGAAGTDSLTVLRVSDDGTLTVVDHVLDSLETRFGCISALETVEYGDTTYVLAAGADHGISLFVLSAEGRLVHLNSLADGAGLALGGVSGLAAIVRDEGIDVLTTAGSEAGLSHFRIDLSNQGGVVAGGSGLLTGSAGDDILSDGAGVDTLTGGAGADIFLLRADGQRDIITDITPGQDILDLSAWPLLQNIGQLEIIPTGYGAVIRFGDEVLELHSADGSILDEADIARLIPFILPRYDVEIGPLEVSVPPPPPPPPPPPAPVVGTVLNGDEGANRLVATIGDDLINAYGGNDTVYGLAGNDGIRGHGGDDLLYGGGGNDNISASDGNDTVYGGDGIDSLGGGYGDDLIHGGEGDDNAGGGPGDDKMYAGPGNDWFSGGAQHDYVDGGSGNDKVAGSYGHDTVVGGDGNDSLGGGNGHDTLYGGAGNDMIGAGDHNDAAHGGLGNDYLGGAGGNDTLYGDEGSDTLNGGYGDDTLFGGSGADVFLFNNFTGDGSDVIRDFEDGIDRLRLVGQPLGTAAPLSELHITNVQFEGQTAARLSYGDYTITITGITSADLNQEDFIFF